MKQPLRWKLRRELLRLCRQLIEFPSFVTRYLFSVRYYDLVLSRRKKIRDGNAGSSTRVAVFAIFPSYGLTHSHIHTLKYFKEKGYAAVVVSNATLSAKSRDIVLKYCWKYIERPNYGYDFGAYRDGIFFVKNSVKSIENVILLNDSAWFPLPGSSDWIDSIEALDVDFAGAATNYSQSGINAESYKDVVWDYSDTKKRFHYCSYGLSFSKRILTDPEFLKYWRNLKITNRKRETVRFGEIGLTQWVLRHHYSHAATCDIRNLDSELEGCSGERIHEILQNLVIPEDPRLNNIKHTVLKEHSNSPHWRSDAVKLILTAVLRQGCSYALPEFSIREKGFQFLKKSPVWLDEEASDITMRIASQITDEYGLDILGEAADLRAMRTNFPEMQLAIP